VNHPGAEEGGWRVAGLLLRKMTLRHWRESWFTYLVLLAIVAVGVGAFNGIRQASRAASANFGLFNEAVSGRSDFFIERRDGVLGEKDLAALGPLTADPDWHLLPVLEGSLAQLNDAGEAVRQLRLVGMDLVSIGNLPGFIEQGLELGLTGGEWYDFFGPRDLAWITHSLANDAGLGEGDAIAFVSGGREQSLGVVGVLGDAGAGLPEDLVVADLPTVQAVLGRAGEIDRMEVLLSDRERRADPGYLQAIRERIEAQLPAGFALQATEERAAEGAGMTAAFRLNLMILSLIAILVGAYLILQALDAAVVRRRSEMATLKSLGVRPELLFRICLLESLLIGLIGSLAGIGVGYLLALGAVHLLADTVNALYFATSAEVIRLTPADWWIGMTLGTTFSLLAGWLPARDAMQTPPAQILSRGDWSPGFSWLRRPQVGLLLLVAGVGALWIPPPVMAGGSKMALGGFLAAGCWIFGAALLSGQILTGLARLGRALSGRAVWRIAMSRLADGSSRHRLAVAGLVVAVGMVTGMFQMVGSFRGTIERWFDVRFQAELYVSERGVSGAGTINGIDPAIMEALRATPELDFMDALYIERVEAPVGTTVLAGVDFSVWENREVEQIWMKPIGSLTVVAGAEPAIVSETFARRFGVLNGGAVTLGTATGPRTVSPVGIFSDYGNEFGSAVIDLPQWRDWTGKERAINTSLYLKDGVEVNALRDRLRLEFPGLDIRNAGELRTLAMGIFEQTFRVTAALNGIGIAVALAGLLLGLVAIFEESARTWRTLDHLGFSRGRLLLAAGLEGAGIGLAAWVAGTLIGLALGWVLIAVINVQSFGWTLLWQVPVAGFLKFGLGLVVAGYLCGLASGAWWQYSRERL
jgi:putative ABC transport system permease protein